MGRKAKPEIVKKKKKEKRKKQTWVERQLKRCDIAIKYVTKLEAHIGAAKAPKVTSHLPATALQAMMSLRDQITFLPANWKPAKGHRPGTHKKVGINSVIQIKPDLDKQDLVYFKNLPAHLFNGAKVKDDDHRNWLVWCTDKTANGDHIVRCIPKKYVMLKKDGGGVVEEPPAVVKDEPGYQSQMLEVKKLPNT
jgi:hypothetical protein